MNSNNKVELPFTQKCLCYPKSIVQRIFSSPRDNTILTPNFFHKPFCMKNIPRTRLALSTPSKRHAVNGTPLIEMQAALNFILKAQKIISIKHEY